MDIRWCEQVVHSKKRPSEAGAQRSQKRPTASLATVDRRVFALSPAMEIVVLDVYSVSAEQQREKIGIHASARGCESRQSQRHRSVEFQVCAHRSSSPGCSRARGRPHDLLRSRGYEEHGRSALPAERDHSPPYAAMILRLAVRFAEDGRETFERPW